jgi:hypothetical protein
VLCYVLAHSGQARAQNLVCNAMQGLPQTGAGGMPWVYGLVLLAMGLLTSWPGPVCNVVVFAEVVPEVRPGPVCCWAGKVIATHVLQ